VKRYYGQLDADRFIHKKYISNPFPNGTFLELGAMNGIKHSNTKFFEDNMGFNKGILIEPDPRTFKVLKKNRPNCYNFNYAVHHSLKEVVFLQSPRQDPIGCLESESSSTFIEKWHFDSKKITLPASTLSDIIAQTDLKYIDFWSLDVEGSELTCLKSMNWDIPVGLLFLEVQHTDHSESEEINTILETQGFTEIARYKRDFIYFNFNYFRKNLFSI